MLAIQVVMSVDEQVLAAQEEVPCKLHDDLNVIGAAMLGAEVQLHCNLHSRAGHTNSAQLLWQGQHAIPGPACATLRPGCSSALGTQSPQYPSLK